MGKPTDEERGTAARQVELPPFDVVWTALQIKDPHDRRDALYDIFAVLASSDAQAIRDRLAKPERGKDPLLARFEKFSDRTRDKLLKALHARVAGQQVTKPGTKPGTKAKKASGGDLDKVWTVERQDPRMRALLDVVAQKTPFFAAALLVRFTEKDRGGDPALTEFLKFNKAHRDAILAALKTIAVVPGTRPGVRGTSEGEPNDRPYYVVRMGFSVADVARYLTGTPKALSGLNSSLDLNKPLVSGTQVHFKNGSITQSVAHGHVYEESENGTYIGKPATHTGRRRTRKFPELGHIEALLTESEADAYDEMVEERRTLDRVLDEARDYEPPEPQDLFRMSRVGGLGGGHPVYGPNYTGLIPATGATADYALGMLSALASGVLGFILGVISGLSGEIGLDQLKDLAWTLTSQFWEIPAMGATFVAGTVVGIAEDIKDIVEQAIKFATDFDRFVKEIEDLLNALFSESSYDICFALGKEIGKQQGKKIAAVVTTSPANVAYELGRVIGPTIAYIVLAALGFPVGPVAHLKKVLELFKKTKVFLKRKRSLRGHLHGTKAAPSSTVAPDGDALVIESPIDTQARMTTGTPGHADRAVDVPEVDGSMTIDRPDDVQTSRKPKKAKKPRKPKGFTPNRVGDDRAVKPGAGYDEGWVEEAPRVSKNVGTHETTPEEALYGIPSAKLRKNAVPSGRRTSVAPDGLTELRDMQGWANSQLPIGSHDPAFPSLKTTTTAHADHIVPYEEIRKMPGFAQLSAELQQEIVHTKGNFAALSEAANTSKGSKSFAEWTRHDRLNLEVDPVWRKQMIDAEAKMRIVVQNRIDALLKLQAADQFTEWLKNYGQRSIPIE